MAIDKTDPTKWKLPKEGEDLSYLAYGKFPVTKAGKNHRMPKKGPKPKSIRGKMFDKLTKLVEKYDYDLGKLLGSHDFRVAFGGLNEKEKKYCQIIIEGIMNGTPLEEIRAEANQGEIKFTQATAEWTKLQRKRFRKSITFDNFIEDMRKKYPDVKFTTSKERKMMEEEKK